MNKNIIVCAGWLDGNPKIGQLFIENPRGEEIISFQFERGAELAFNICLAMKIKIAILKENSPSCGVHKIHDGSFSDKLIDGMGVTTEFLKRKGIKVISENEIDTLL